MAILRAISKLYSAKLFFDRKNILCIVREYENEWKFGKRRFHAANYTHETIKVEIKTYFATKRCIESSIITDSRGIRIQRSNIRSPPTTTCYERIIVNGAGLVVCGSTYQLIENQMFYKISKNWSFKSMWRRGGLWGFPCFWPQKSAVPLLSPLQIWLGSWNLICTFSRCLGCAFLRFRLFSPHFNPARSLRSGLLVEFFHFHHFLSLFPA